MAEYLHLLSFSLKYNDPIPINYPQIPFLNFGRIFSCLAPYQIFSVYDIGSWLWKNISNGIKYIFSSIYPSDKNSKVLLLAIRIFLWHAMSQKIKNATGAPHKKKKKNEKSNIYLNYKFSYFSLVPAIFKISLFLLSKNFSRFLFLQKKSEILNKPIHLFFRNNPFLTLAPKIV